MKNCFKSCSLSVTVIFMAVSTIMMTCCTQVDDTLGGGLIPKNQTSETKTATIILNKGEHFDAYLTYTDSVPSYGNRLAMMGKGTHPFFGNVQAASVLQFMPTSKTIFDDYVRGVNPVVDSLKLTVFMNHTYGNKDIEQTFDVYRMTDSLRLQDSILFAVNFEYENLIDKNKPPVFSFQYKGQSTGFLDVIRLTLTDEGRGFATELMETLLADTSLFNDGAKFKELFYGLVFVPSENSPVDGSIIYTNLHSTYLTLYYHNYREDEPTRILQQDIPIAFHLDDLESYTNRNYSIISLRHDYSGTQIADVKENPLELTDTGYIQGLAGVTTQITLNDDFFRAIDDLRGDDAILINQAELYIWIGNDSTESLGGSHQRLGSYLRYSTQVPIMDYAFEFEASGNTIPYSGYLNRTFGYYMMDISAYLMHSLKDESIRNFTIAPVAIPTNEPLMWKETSLVLSDGGQRQDKQPRLKLTYTLIKDTN